MSVQRILSADGRTDGWQARAHLVRNRYLSRFFAARKHGGMRKALRLAEIESERLQRRAKWLVSRGLA